MTARSRWVCLRHHAIDPSYNLHSYSPLVLQLTFDLWPWADLAKNLISSSTPGGAPLYQVWWKSTQGFSRFCVNEVKIAYLDQVHWPLTLGESRPKSNQFIYSWWWKSTQGFLRFCVNEVKIAYWNQVHWPLTLGGSRPKSNQFIYSGWCTPDPCTKFDENPPRGSSDFALTR